MATKNAKKAAKKAAKPAPKKTASKVAKNATKAAPKPKAEPVKAKPNLSTRDTSLRPKQNGVTHPRTGTTYGELWKLADALKKELKRVPNRGEFIARAESAGYSFNIAAQARHLWTKFHGFKREKGVKVEQLQKSKPVATKAPKVNNTPKADPKPAAKKQAAKKAKPEPKAPAKKAAKVAKKPSKVSGSKSTPESSKQTKKSPEASKAVKKAKVEAAPNQAELGLNTPPPFVSGRLAAASKAAESAA